MFCQFQGELSTRNKPASFLGVKFGACLPFSTIHRYTIAPVRSKIANVVLPVAVIWLQLDSQNISAWLETDHRHGSEHINDISNGVTWSRVAQQGPSRTKRIKELNAYWTPIHESNRATSSTHGRTWVRIHRPGVVSSQSHCFFASLHQRIR